MKTAIRHLFLIFFFISCLSSLVAQPIPSSTWNKLDRLYADFAKQQHAPGLAYGIVYEGKLVHVGSFGYANLEDSIPVTSQTVFRIASMTKSFISAAIVKLRDEGKIRLDDPLDQYIPAFKQQKLLTTDAPAITIRHLLTHAAGFPEDNPWGDRQLDISHGELDSLIQAGFSFSNAPGIAYEYSNTAFALLGRVIKQITGLSYNEYINREILNPLGMKNTYWEYEDVPKDKLAVGYRWINNRWIKQPMLHDGAYGAMGGMLTSMEDFSKYVSLHLKAWPPRNGQDEGPVKRASLREMQHPWNFNALDTDQKGGCPVTMSYAYGLRWSADCKGRITVGHTGGLPGFGSNWIILPDYGLGIICFGNVTYVSAAAVNMHAMRLLTGTDGIQARKIPVSEILEQRKKELLTFLPDWKQDGRELIFAENFFLDNYEDQLREASRQLFDSIGRIKEVSEIQAQNNLRGTFKIRGEQGTLLVYFTLSPESSAKIQQLNLRIQEKEN